MPRRTCKRETGALGVPVGTVRSRLARARQHLRDRAAKCEPGSGAAAARLAAVRVTGLEDLR